MRLEDKVRNSIFFKAALASADKLLLKGRSKKLKNLLIFVSDKATSSAENEKSGVAGILDNLKAAVRMIVAYAKGEYKEAPWKTLVSIVGAFIYFATPIDLIPDFIPLIGFFDDFALLTWMLNSTMEDIVAYKAWEESVKPNINAEAL